ncbi:putative transcription factor Hap3/NF-YB family [Dioscorea sansibarensis]
MSLTFFLLLAWFSILAVLMDDVPSEFSVCYSCQSSSSQEAPQLYNFLQVPTTPQTDHVMINDVQRELRLQTSDQHLNELERKHLQIFWQHQMREMDSLPVNKQNQLPVSRIKKVMKLDKSVKMVSASAPVVLGKACELFILELTVRSWLRKESMRHTLLKSDIAGAILDTDHFDFLANLVTDDNSQQEESDE